MLELGGSAVCFQPAKFYISCFADGDLLFLLVQKKKAKKDTPVSVLFFAFANFYGQFVNLPLRGFGHDKLTLKSSRKRSGTEDGEIKNKTQSVMILITALWLFSPKNSIFCSSLLNCPSGCEICREIFLVFEERSDES